MSESLVPLNDAGDSSGVIRKSSSFGSDSSIVINTDGKENTTEFRIQAVVDGGKVVSLWHDISLDHVDPETKKPTEYRNFVCEIPKFTRYVVVYSSCATAVILVCCLF